MTVTPEGARRTTRASAGAAEELGGLEREVERLPRVQARVAHGLVALLEVRAEDFVGATQALGDVLAGELDVEPARPDVGALTRGEELVDLGRDVVEAAGLVPALVLERVAVHRV